MIGQHAQWQWHRPGIGEQLSPLPAVRGSSGKPGLDLFCVAGWLCTHCLIEKSSEKRHTTRIRSRIINQSQHKKADWVPVATTEGEKRILYSFCSLGFRAQPMWTAGGQRFTGKSSSPNSPNSQGRHLFTFQPSL